MGNKLYVGNISYDASDASLKEHFAQCGTVASAKIVTDRDTGRSRGFGFVEMATEEDADNAISSLHEADFLGRNLVVNEAKERKPVFQDRKNGNNYRGGGRDRRGGGRGYNA